MRINGRHVVRALGWGLGAAAVAWLVRTTDLGEAVAALRSVGASFAWLLLPYAVATALYALPWGLLLARDVRPGWGALVATRFAASAVNVLLPSGVFGEPVRLKAIRPEARRAAGEALVWDRALYLAASGLFVVLVALGGRGPLSRPVSGVAVVVSAGLFAAGAALAGATRLAPLRRWLERLSAGAGERPMPWRAALAGFALHFVARGVVASELWLGARLLGVNLDVRSWLLATAAVVLAAAAAPVVPGQVGVQEAALTAALGSVGVPPSAGLALGLLVRLRQLVFVPVGLALAMRRRGAPACPGAAPPSRA